MRYSCTTTAAAAAAAVAAGITALPLAFAGLGLLLGSAAILSVALVTYFSLLILIRWACCAVLRRADVPCHAVLRGGPLCQCKPLNVGAKGAGAPDTHPNRPIRRCARWLGPQVYPPPPPRHNPRPLAAACCRGVESQGAPTYAAAAEQLYGRWAELAVRLCIILSGLGWMVLYLVIVQDVVVG